MSLSGTANGMKGTIYAHAARLTLSGNGVLQAALVVDTLRLSGNAGSSLIASSAVSAEAEAAILAAGQLLTGVLWISIQDPDGTMTADQFARTRSSIASINTTFGAYGVELVEVDAASGDYADVRVSVASTSACGGQADGILGCFTADGTITLSSGWDWYTGSDAAAVGGTQFDLETIVTHEVGHSVGVEHSSDTNSTMYYALAPGVVRRNFTQADLDQLTHASDGGETQSLMSALRVNAQGEISSAGNGNGTCPFCGPRHAVNEVELEANDIPALLISSTLDAAASRSRLGSGLFGGRFDDSAAPLDVRDGLQSLAPLTDPYERGIGSHRDDILLGGDGDDLILGRDGNGVLSGSSGHDVLVGGFDADRLTDNDRHDDDIIDAAISSELDDWTGASSADWFI